MIYDQWYSSLDDPTDFLNLMVKLPLSNLLSSFQDSRQYFLIDLVAISSSVSNQACTEDKKKARLQEVVKRHKNNFKHENKIPNWLH